MPQTLVPIFIKPHLVPFLFKKLRVVEYMHEGKTIKAAKVTNHTSLGRYIRLMMEKSEIKTLSDKTSQTFLLVQNYAKPLEFMRGAYKYEDGRKGFLHLPEAAERMVNLYLEEDFETAMFYHIHSRHQSDSNQSLDNIIIEFFTHYNLEEFGFNTLQVRRDYYRKVQDGYFDARIIFDSLTEKIKLAK